MRKGSTPRAWAMSCVLVLDVAEDEGAVAEADHPEQEGLHQGALAAAGFAEDEDVGVGDAGWCRR